MRNFILTFHGHAVAAVLVGWPLAASPLEAAWPWPNENRLSIRQKLDPEDDSASYSCRLEQREFETEETCYEVERQVICIPKVVFPWQRVSGYETKQPRPQGCDQCAINHSARSCRVRQVKRVTPRSYQKLDVRPVWVPEKTDQQTAHTTCTSCDDGLGFLGTNGMLESDQASQTGSET